MKKIESAKSWDNNFLDIRSFGRTFLIRGLELVVLSTVASFAYFYANDWNFSTIHVLATLTVTLISYAFYQILFGKERVAREDSLITPSNVVFEIFPLKRNEKNFLYLFGDLIVASFYDAMPNLKRILSLTFLVFVSLGGIFFLKGFATSEIYYFGDYLGNILIMLLSFQILIESLKFMSESIRNLFGVIFKKTITPKIKRRRKQI